MIHGTLFLKHPLKANDSDSRKSAPIDLGFCVDYTEVASGDNPSQLDRTCLGCQDFWNIKKRKILEDSGILRLKSYNSPVTEQYTKLSGGTDVLFIETSKRLLWFSFLSPLLCYLPGATQVVPSHLSPRKETFSWEGSWIQLVNFCNFFL